jgi:hypothetical protein
MSHLPDEAGAVQGRNPPVSAIGAHLQFKRRRQPRGNDVLVPGTHRTDKDILFEVGNHHFANQTIAVLPTVTDLFRYGGTVITIAGDMGDRSMKPLTTEGMRLLVDSQCQLRRWVRKGKKQVCEFVPCSRDLAGLVLEAATVDPLVREIELFTKHPVFTVDWSVCNAGYSKFGKVRAGEERRLPKIYYDPPAELRGLEPETDREVIAQTLDSLLVDFPFAETSSWENYISLLLTPFVRPALTGNVPAFLIHSPLERTGKSILAEDLFGGITTGMKTPAMQLPSTNDEMNKLAISMLAEGKTIAHLDNAPEFVDLPALASLLTAKVYQGRRLGTSTMATYPNNLTIVTTGNNVRLSGELAKRMVPILLQPTTDAPEKRKDFVHPNIWGYVVENRPMIVACLLGMVVNWRNAGAPKGDVAMGGFDEWAGTIGGILRHHGYVEWMRNAPTWQSAADEQRSDLKELVKAWNHQHNTGMVTVAELLDIAKGLELFPEITLSDKGAKAVQTSFGMRVLGRNVDVPVGEFIIRRHTASRPTLYFLRPINQPPEGS